MDLSRFTRVDETTWRIDPHGAMRVPATIYADENLMRDMDDKVYEQAVNVAMLPGIMQASYAMPDAHWGYGFPIGGVAAFDAERGGVVSAGGVGFDISCGVRTMLTGLKVPDILPVQLSLADSLYRQIPAGVGSTGAITLDTIEMNAMLSGGARWAVDRGWGEASDLERIEENGTMGGAMPENVSERARERQCREMGTLGSGNHYLEVQAVAEIFDSKVAGSYGLAENEVVVTIHCGSRGLGHQIGTEYLRDMVVAASASGITLPDRELACAPIKSDVGQRYLGAMRAAINCALANREILGHFARRVFAHFFSGQNLSLLFDVSHNTCKVEPHVVDGKRRELFVHRKGATRAFGPWHESLPVALRSAGQPVLIGGSMGRVHIYWRARLRPSRKHSRLPATVPGARCRVTRRSSNGADARSRMICGRRAFLLEARRRVASPRKRLAPIRTSVQLLPQLNMRDLPAVLRVCALSSASRVEVTPYVDRRS